MVVLSTSFAVLTCLCAALPLAHLPGVEGAHVHASHSMQTHSSSRSQHRTHSATPSATHAHDGGKHKGQRSPGFPPLLRRDRADDHKKAHDHPGQGSHDRTHSKGHRSAFARSRYRRPSGTHPRRSSVHIPGEHGDTYLVSRTPSRKWEYGQSSHAHYGRQVGESNVVLGRIDIMGTGQSSDSMQRLASLTVDSAPIDWKSGQSSAKAFTMNASTSNQTQFIMMPVGGSSDAAGSSTKHVALATEVFDAGSTEMVMYCATYDSDPGSASALLMTPCTGVAQSAAQASDAIDPCANDATSSTVQDSQVFSYDPSSGKLEPISSTGSSAVDDSSDYPSSLCGGARVRRDGNSTTSVSVTSSSTSTSTAPTPSASQSTRNVTLVYVAGALEVPPSSSGSSSNTTTTTNAGQSAVLTTTITTTVVSTVTASGSSASSDRSGSPAQAAASPSASSVSSPLAAGTATPPVSASSASRSSASSSSSVPATTSSSASTRGDQTLQVEIVGATSPTPSPSAASTSGTATTTTSSSSSASHSLNAQAVASSIANQMPHARRVFVSAVGNVHLPNQGNGS